MKLIQVSEKSGSEFDLSRPFDRYLRECKTDPIYSCIRFDALRCEFSIDQTDLYSKYRLANARDDLGLFQGSQNSLQLLPVGYRGHEN